MSDLIVVFLAGLLAAGVDGSLGMGFGPTSSTVLLAAGLSPSTVSATVNIAKIGSGLAGALAHWRFGNVDKRLVLWLAVPGALGAVLGVTVLAVVEVTILRPILAVLLLAVGLRILWRFSTADVEGTPMSSAPSSTPGPGIGIAGGLGGCTNGLIGAWGPVVTPYLLHRGVSPRMAVGSANTAEVAVAVVSVGALIGSGTASAAAGVTLAMLAGGVVAAPLAAMAISRIPTRIAGLALAALLLLTQCRELAGAAGLGDERWIAYGATVLVVALSARPRRRRDRGASAPARAAHPPADRPA